MSSLHYKQLIKHLQKKNTFRQTFVFIDIDLGFRTLNVTTTLRSANQFMFPAWWEARYQLKWRSLLHLPSSYFTDCHV